MNILTLYLGYPNIVTTYLRLLWINTARLHQKHNFTTYLKLLWINIARLHQKHNSHHQGCTVQCSEEERKESVTCSCCCLLLIFSCFGYFCL